MAEKTSPRPLSHDLFKNILQTVNYPLAKIQITELKKGTFFAKVFLEHLGETLVFDARPSDAIALALRFKSPMYVHENLFKEAGVEVSKEENQEKTQNTPLGELKKSLELAIKEERYEDAAALKKKIIELEMNDLLNN